VRSLVLLFLIAGTCTTGLSQEVEVKGLFLADSIHLGETVRYVLSARYSQNADIFFPDSTFSFAPFEFQGKRFFATETSDSISYDSAVYMLTTYEIDSVQLLALPVFVYHPSDCTAYTAQPDTLFFSAMVAAMPDSVSAQELPLKANTDYQKVKWILNYPVLLAIAFVLILLLVVAWFVFGKRIKRYFILLKLKKNYREFIDRFAPIASLEKISSEEAEKAVTLWKNYMERLEQKPYTKFTSKEIAEVEKNAALSNALQIIDRFIYGGVAEHHLQPLATLRNYSEQQFQRRIQEVQHG
jgi:hypothetical protein